MGYQMTAALLLLAFYGCYFVKMLDQKKKGIRTDQLGKNKTGFVKFIEIAVKLASVLTLVTELVSIVLRTTLFPGWMRILGIGIAALGVVIFIISVCTMRENWRAGVPSERQTELVTDGIYQISRNPAFLGFDLVYIGLLLLFFNIALMIVTAFTVLLFHLQIVNVEEEFLLSAFGEEYAAYKSRVCRYLGRKRRPRQV